MGITEILGYLGALLIGVVLGLIGGGGSILTVPVLVYLLSINPVTATAYSLFVVGVTSLFGSIRNFQKKRVDLKTAVVFSIPAFIAVYLTRKFLVPAIPETIMSIGDLTITKDIGIMLFFALIMVLASVSMILEPSEKDAKPKKVRFNYLFITLEGAIVGVLTGIVGAGGGFLNYTGPGAYGEIAHEKSSGYFFGDHSCEVADWLYWGCGKPRYQLAFSAYF